MPYDLVSFPWATIELSYGTLYHRNPGCQRLATMILGGRRVSYWPESGAWTVSQPIRFHSDGWMTYIHGSTSPETAKADIEMWIKSESDYRTKGTA